MQHMFTSTSSGFAITLGTKNVARDLAKSSNSGPVVLKDGFTIPRKRQWLSVAKPGGNPTILTWSS